MTNQAIITLTSYAADDPIAAAQMMHDQQAKILRLRAALNEVVEELCLKAEEQPQHGEGPEWAEWLYATAHNLEAVTEQPSSVSEPAEPATEPAKNRG